jgi:hypothetical protein
MNIHVPTFYVQLVRYFLVSIYQVSLNEETFFSCSKNGSRLLVD